MNLTTNATINLRLSFDDRGDIAVSTVITNTEIMYHDDYTFATYSELELEDLGHPMGFCYTCDVTKGGNTIDKLICMEEPNGEEVFFLESNKDFEFGGEAQILIAKIQRRVIDAEDLPF